MIQFGCNVQAMESFLLYIFIFHGSSQQVHHENCAGDLSFMNYKRLVINKGANSSSSGSVFEAPVGRREIL